MKINSLKWYSRFLKMAHETASWSKDDSSKVGCVIVNDDGMVVSMGYNGMPRGVDDNIKDRYVRPYKYLWFEHAERNAIYQAIGSVKGCTLFVTHVPCADCARAIVQTGINNVIIDAKNGKKSEFMKRMKESAQVSLTMFKEAGIQVTEHEIGIENENEQS